MDPCQVPQHLTHQPFFLHSPTLLHCHFLVVRVVSEKLPGHVPTGRLMARRGQGRNSAIIHPHNGPGTTLGVVQETREKARRKLLPHYHAQANACCYVQANNRVGLVPVGVGR